MAGWSFRAAGSGTDRNVIAVLREKLEGLRKLPDAGADAVTFTPGPDGWAVEGNGQSDDPGAHAAVLAHVKDAIDDPAAGTGTSEFNGPFVAVQNFHAPAPLGTPATGGAPS